VPWTSLIFQCVGSTLLWSDGAFLLDCTASHPCSNFYVFIYTYIVCNCYKQGIFFKFSNKMQLYSVFLYFCRQLYMFRVLTPIIRSSYNCKYSFWYWLTGSAAIRSRCWVRTNSTTRPDGSRPGWPVPEAVITVVRAPDDGCQHPKHVELPTEM